ncbi:MAG: VCBS repeat-containing protein [candidate division Zixibacteria bacterium]
MGTYQIALADLDDDGDMDAVFSNMHARTLILFNDGFGNYLESDQIFSQGYAGVEARDIDRDHDLDLLFGPSHEVYTRSPLYLNNGTGVFEEGQLDVRGTGIFTIGAHLVDVDGDGDLDALFQKARETILYINDGKSNFSLSSATYPDMSVFCDLNDDGFVDIFAREVGQGFRVYLNNGDGEFSKFCFFENRILLRCSTVFADVDNDGDPDAIYTNGEGKLYPSGILLNDGTGRFVESNQELPSVDMSWVCTNDLNGDGWVDLVFTDWGRPCQVWINDGAGKFEDSGIRFAGKGRIACCEIADIDNDGDNDVFIGNYTDGTNTIWFNQTYVSQAIDGKR